jgi:hypothetical protein
MSRLPQWPKTQCYATVDIMFNFPCTCSSPWYHKNLQDLEHLNQPASSAATLLLHFEGENLLPQQQKELVSMSTCTSFRNNLWKSSNCIKNGKKQINSYKLKSKSNKIRVLLLCGDLWAAEDRRKDDSSGGSMTKLTRGNNNTAIDLSENIYHKAIELIENINLHLK